MNALLSKSRMLLCGLVLLATTISLSACDSGGDDSGLTMDDIVGTYTFTQLSFDPEGSQVSVANVLDTLVTAQTSLTLNQSGQFLLNYQFQNGPAGEFVAGSYSFSDNEVSITIDGNFSDVRRKLILPSSFTLDANTTGTVLQASINREGITLTEFSGRYFGVPPIDGVLNIRLQKQ